MSGGFVKLYGTILDSSVWLEAPATRLVWITLLAMADQYGQVQASVGGLAHRANVPREDAELALDRLSAPDPDDRSGVQEGRRIVTIQGGWEIVNYRAYRELRTDEQVKAARRKAQQRDKSRDKKGQTRQSRKSRIEAEADIEDRTQLPHPTAVVQRDLQALDAGGERRPDRTRSAPKNQPASIGDLIPVTLQNLQADSEHAETQLRALEDQRVTEGATP